MHQLFNIQTLNGTCIGQLVTLVDPKVWPKTYEQLFNAFTATRLSVLTTTEEQKEFRDLLIAHGASSVKVDDDTYHHAINPANFVEPKIVWLGEWIEAGKKLSRDEKRLFPTEIRVGDHAIYNYGGKISQGWFVYGECIITELYQPDPTRYLNGFTCERNTINGLLEHRTVGGWFSQNFVRIPTPEQRKALGLKE